MLVPQFADLKARINDLIIKSTSIPSSSPEISTTATNNARDKPPTQPKYPIKKPSMRLFPETKAPLPTIEVVTKHSHAFNSSTATGLDKLGQLQFANVVKGWIIETAPLITASNFDKDTFYKVVFTARKSCTEISSALVSVGVTSLYTAKLFAVTSNLLESRWTLVEQSGETDFLVDAVEDLWERVMDGAGSRTGGMEVGAVATESEMIRRKENQLVRKSVGW